QSSPCTWAEINAAFPAAQVYGRFLLHAGSNCNGFDGNADALRVSVNYAQTTYDFDVDPATPTPSPTATATVAPSPTPTPTPACVPPSVVYVDDDWSAVVPGTDPDAGGPAMNFGCDSFATIQGGIDGVA